MIIRHARPSDAGAIATYLLMAMEDIVYGFIGIKDPAAAFEFMHYFTQRESNQYSWQNCWLVEVGNTVGGCRKCV
jgi:hypothetical protein